MLICNKRPSLFDHGTFITINIIMREFNISIGNGDIHCLHLYPFTINFYQYIFMIDGNGPEPKW